MASKKCSHPGCGCEIEPGSSVLKNGRSYCSQYCASATGSGKCECGHRIVSPGNLTCRLSSTLSIGQQSSAKVINVTAEEQDESLILTHTSSEDWFKSPPLDC
jgi:hypothetical protein